MAGMLMVLRSGRSEVEEILRMFWYPAAVFGLAEVITYLGWRRSFFEKITEGAFELDFRFESVVELHVWASVLMWSLGAVQVVWERARRSPELVWAHRRMGQAMLLVFFVVVFPTSLYLTFRQRVDWLSTGVGAVLLDTAFCTAYFLYRGWRVVRRRRTSKALGLHGRLMQCGVLMSMSILPQRFLQLYLTAQFKAHQLNYSISILVTAILFVVFGHFLDGPRGGIWMACIGREHCEEAYGSAVPSAAERWAWRLRWVAYSVLYCGVRHACGAADFVASSPESPSTSGGG